MAKNSLLPFVILGSGFVWYTLLEWLRRRPSLQPRENGAPGTHYMMVLGAMGLLLCVIGAAVVAMKVWH